MKRPNQMISQERIVRLQRYQEVQLFYECLVGQYRRDGSRIIELERLGEFVETVVRHCVTCVNAHVQLLGESTRYGLASTLLFQCRKCSKKFKLISSSKIAIGKSSHYSVNVGAVLGQISTGGGSAHLNEQMETLEFRV